MLVLSFKVIFNHGPLTAKNIHYTDGYFFASLRLCLIKKMAKVLSWFCFNSKSELLIFCHISEVRFNCKHVKFLSVIIFITESRKSDFRRDFRKKKHQSERLIRSSTWESRSTEIILTDK